MRIEERVFSGLTGTLAGFEAGTHDGNPLLCIHGWLDNAASFLPLAEQLPQFRWICIDLPGHGKSAYRPQGAIYHFIDYIGDVYRVLESCDFARCTLIGHSLGAGIAAYYAAVFPKMVDRLVLLDGIGPISHNPQSTLQQLRESLNFLSGNAETGPRFYASWEQLVNRRLATGDISRKSVETLLSRGTVRDGKGAAVLSDNRLKQRSPLYMSQQKVLSILRGIEARTLLIIADQGLVAKRSSTPERIAAIRHLQQEMVSGAHHVHLDRPARVATAIKKFLVEQEDVS